MKRMLLLSIIYFLLFSAPGFSIAQPYARHGSVNPLGEVTTGRVDGRLHFHSDPSEDHYAFESLEHHSYQYYALHGYEHYKGKGLQNLDTFRDIQYPKEKPNSPPGSDSFFGVKSYNPLKW